MSLSPSAAPVAPTPPRPSRAKEPWLRRAARAYGLVDARTYGSAIWILVAGSVVSTVGRGVAQPFIVLYLTRVVGIPLALIGLGVLLENVVRALASPLAGSASDRFGRKPVMFAGLVGSAIAIPSYVLVRGPVSYLAVATLVGFAEALFRPASSALIADITPPGRRTGPYGLNHVAVNLGWVIGILIGAGITNASASFVPLFVVGGVMPAVYAGFLLLFIHEPKHVERASRGNPFRDIGLLMRDRTFVAYTALLSAFFLAFGQYNTVLPLFVVEGAGLPTSAIALALVVNPALIVFLQLPFGVRGDRVDRSRTLAVGAIFLVANYAILAGTGFFVASGFSPMVALVAAGVAFTFGEMLFAPAMTAAVAEMAPAGHVGGAMGLMGLASAVGIGAAPVLASVVVGTAGWSWLWTIFAAFTFVSSLGLLLFRPRFKARAAAKMAEAPASVAS